MYLILYSSLQTWILNRLLGQLTVDNYNIIDAIASSLWYVDTSSTFGFWLTTYNCNWNRCITIKNDFGRIELICLTQTLLSSMWPTLAISQSGDNQQKQLVLIGLILQTPSADNSAKYSRNQKSARDPEWQGEYSAIHAGQNINKMKCCLLLLSFEYVDKIISFRAWQYCIPWFISCNQS